MNDTTNDPQAPYERVLADCRAKWQECLAANGMTADDAKAEQDALNTPTERAPMLSNDVIFEIARRNGETASSAFDVSAWYEAKITSGELRVVTTIVGDPFEHIYECAGVHIMGAAIDRIRVCPGCGAQIVKE